MKDKYKSLRNNLVWAGLIIAFVSRILVAIMPFAAAFALGLSCFGLVLVVIGCYFWAKYKGRNPAWTVFGVIAPIGFIPLAVLRDKMPTDS
jgi:hypothetical protein